MQCICQKTLRLKYVVIIELFVSDLLDSLSSASRREISHPSLVDSRGQHISYSVHDPSAKQQPNSRTYFKLEAFGKKYLLNVSTSSHFITHNATNSLPVVEYIEADGTSRTKTVNHSRHCFHSGHVHLMLGAVERGTALDIDGWVAVSSCLGLVSIH